MLCREMTACVTVLAMYVLHQDGRTEYSFFRRRHSRELAWICGIMVIAAGYCTTASQASEQNAMSTGPQCNRVCKQSEGNHSDALNR